MPTSIQPANASSHASREVYRDLVETLFVTPGSFVAGVLGGLIAPVIAWFATADSTYLIFSAVITCFAVYRLILLVAHSRTPVEERREQAKSWEVRYAIGGIGFMTAVGCSVAFLFYQHGRDVLGYYGVIIMISGAGGLAGRNAGRPWIVMTQMIGLCTPITIAALLTNDPLYFGLAFIFVLLMVSVNSTTKFLHANLELALRNGLDASMQRGMFKNALNSMSHGLCMGSGDKALSVVNHRLTDFFHVPAPSGAITLPQLASEICAQSELSPKEANAFIEKWLDYASHAKTSVFSQQFGARIFDFRCERTDEGGFVTVVEDVTEQRKAVREIERIAHFDTLTNLPNRFQFQQRLDRDLRQIRKRGRKLTLLYIDLDHFKEVNDSLGHSIGDALLIQVAMRLRECVRPIDMVARFGGDEFCILLQPAETLPDVDVIAKRIIQTLSQPYVIERHTIIIGASIGICVAASLTSIARGNC